MLVEPPEHLSGRRRGLLEQVTSTFVLEPAETELLLLGLEALTASSRLGGSLRGMAS
jgi:hypothetical protein